MQSIEGVIQLVKKANLSKDEFINNELKPKVSTSFSCANCSQDNNIEIIPLQTGYPFFQIYKNNYLTKEEIVRVGIAEPAASWASHFGQFLVYNLPTLYFKTLCEHCDKEFMVVYGLGESQPGKWMCKISSVWQIEIN